MKKRLAFVLGIATAPYLMYLPTEMQKTRYTPGFLHPPGILFDLLDFLW